MKMTDASAKSAVWYLAQHDDNVGQAAHDVEIGRQAICYMGSPLDGVARVLRWCDARDGAGVRDDAKSAARVANLKAHVAAIRATDAAREVTP